MVDHALPPARVTIERITAKRVELYSYVPPPGNNIPNSVQPFLLDDSVTTEDEIEWAVKRLRNNCSGGAVGDVGGAPSAVDRDGTEGLKVQGNG